MRTSQEYPPFVTVLKTVRQKSYVAVMEWDSVNERYTTSSPQTQEPHKDAVQHAKEKAAALGLETRDLEDK